MMPNTSVSPAASRNRSRPNCRPFKHCSMNRVMMNRLKISECRASKRRQRRCAAAVPYRGRSLHRALVVKAILIVLDDGGDGLKCEIAFLVLDRLLQIEILDREVIVPIFEFSDCRF